MGEKLDKIIDEKKIKEAMVGKKIPVLTLDNKWHQLFTQNGASKKIQELSDRVNNLLTAQSRYTEEIKGLKQVKKRLMEEIVASMDEKAKDKAAQKKRLANKKMIDECNEKIDELNDKLLDLPKDMDEANISLMIATAEEFRDELMGNRKKIVDISRWVQETRVELKRKMLEKQKAEEANKKMYGYMHDVFGSELIEILDLELDKTGKGNEE